VPLHLREQAPFFRLHIEVGEDADDDKDRQYNTEGQFQADFVSQHLSSARASINAAFCACPSLVKGNGSGTGTAPRNTIKAGIPDPLFQTYLRM